MSRAKQLILENDDELGGVDPKDYADQALNGPPEYQDEVDRSLAVFCDDVRRDHAKMMRDGVSRLLMTDKGWKRKFRDADKASLLARAVMARRAKKYLNNFREPGDQSMLRIVDNWLRFS